MHYTVLRGGGTRHRRQLDTGQRPRASRISILDVREGVFHSVSVNDCTEVTSSTNLFRADNWRWRRIFSS